MYFFFYYKLQKNVYLETDSIMVDYVTPENCRILFKIQGQVFFCFVSCCHGYISFYCIFTHNDTACLFDISKVKTKHMLIISNKDTFLLRETHTLICKLDVLLSFYLMYFYLFNKLKLIIIGCCQVYTDICFYLRSVYKKETTL